MIGGRRCCRRWRSRRSQKTGGKLALDSRTIERSDYNLGRGKLKLGGLCQVAEPADTRQCWAMAMCCVAWIYHSSFVEGHLTGEIRGQEDKLRRRLQAARQAADHSTVYVDSVHTVSGVLLY